MSIDYFDNGECKLGLGTNKSKRNEKTIQWTYICSWEEFRKACLIWWITAGSGRLRTFFASTSTFGLLKRLSLCLAAEERGKGSSASTSERIKDNRNGVIKDP